MGWGGGEVGGWELRGLVGAAGRSRHATAADDHSSPPPPSHTHSSARLGRVVHGWAAARAARAGARQLASELARVGSIRRGGRRARERGARQARGGVGAAARQAGRGPHVLVVLEPCARANRQADGWWVGGGFVGSSARCRRRRRAGTRESTPLPRARTHPVGALQASVCPIRPRGSPCERGGKGGGAGDATGVAAVRMAWRCAAAVSGRCWGVGWGVGRVGGAGAAPRVDSRPLVHAARCCQRNASTHAAPLPRTTSSITTTTSRRRRGAHSRATCVEQQCSLATS